MTPASRHRQAARRPRLEPVLVVHGGAGPRRAGDDPRTSADLRRHLAAAVQAGFAAMPRGGARAACVAAVACLESVPEYNAGTGSVLADDGRVYCDAAVMLGDGRAGAVAAVEGFPEPIRAADALLETGGPLLWAGRSAELAARLELATVDPDEMVTDRQRARLEDRRRGPAPASMGTVGAVALDAGGRLAAATSTGGTLGKPPARIGDTPLLGAGTWADDATCAVSATGDGEAFMRACFAHAVHARLRWAGQNLATAAGEALADVLAAGGRGGAIAVDAGGEIAVPATAEILMRAHRRGDGPVLTAIDAGESWR